MSGHVEVRRGRERDGEWMQQDDGRNRSGSGGMENGKPRIMRKDLKRKKETKCDRESG